jgi:hypothetical protein
MMFLSLILAASAPTPCDRLADAVRLLEELNTQEALDLVAPMRGDRRCEAKARARAWMLSAEAWFALGEDPSARHSASEAFKLDALAMPLGAVPAVLADLIEDQRQFQVGDTLQPQDKSGTVIDLSLFLPIKVYVPSGKEPIIEARMAGQWRTLTPRKVPGSEGRVFGAALPRRMLDLESISFRYIVAGQTLGPFQRKTAREQRTVTKSTGLGLWGWLGVGTVAVGLGAGVAILLTPEESGCQPTAGLACIELRIRP